MIKIQIKPNKAKERSFLFRFLFCFLWVSAVLTTIYSFSAAMGGGKLFTFKHYIIFELCCIPVSIIYGCIVEKLGSGLGMLMLGWSNRKILPQEQYSADLTRARLTRSRKQFREALIIINEVLEKAPDFPEALLLKAQIVWEGYGNRELARMNLDKILELVHDDDPIRKWAVNYYHDIGKKKE